MSNNKNICPFLNSKCNTSNCVLYEKGKCSLVTIREELESLSSPDIDSYDLYPIESILGDIRDTINSISDKLPDSFPDFSIF